MTKKKTDPAKTAGSKASVKPQTDVATPISAAQKAFNSGQENKLAGGQEMSPEQTATNVCAAHGNKPDELMEILHAVQHDLGFIPEAVIPAIAGALNLSRADVHGVVTFYHDFRRDKAGRHVVKLCRAEACQSMNADAVCNHAEKRLGTAIGGTNADGTFTLEAVYCLGNCALSPAAMIDGHLYGRVTPGRFDEIVGELAKEDAA